jgi:predicted amidohydrolase YtcJ
MRIIYNANIYTLDPDKPKATAIAILGEKIVALGDDQTILAELQKPIEKFDAGGRTIIPGLIDAHLHLQQYALNLNKVNCETASREECFRCEHHITPQRVMDYRSWMEPKQLE